MFVIYQGIPTKDFGSEQFRSCYIVRILYIQHLRKKGFLSRIRVKFLTEHFKAEYSY
jgi:hypothetical protein